MYSLKYQTGDFLVEAMIGTLITALVSLGTLTISTRIMVMQEEMIRQQIVVTSLRENLYTPKAKCAADGEEPVAVTGTMKVINRQVKFSDLCSKHVERYTFNEKLYTVNLQLPSSSIPAADGKTVDYAVGLAPEAK